MGIRTLLLLFLLVSKISFAQLIFEPSFTPKSLVPDLYVTSMEKFNNAEESFAKNSRRENRLSLQRFYANTNFHIDKLFQQGKVSCDNEATKYIENILLSIGLTGYKVYIYLSPYPNAFATDRKEIFVNAGLLSILDTEAELAFVLCHEAMHVNRRHSLSSYMDKFHINVDDAKIDNLHVHAKVDFNQHSYSKNVELEADSLGLSIFSLSDYNINAAVSVLEKLDEAVVPLNGKKLKMNKLFLSKKSNYRKYNSIKGDTLDKESTTHPSSDLRVKSIKRRIRGLVGGTDDYVISKKQFKSIKRQVLKHLPSLYLYKGNVNAAMYCSAQLMNKKNEFDQRKTILKSMYKILLRKHHYAKVTSSEESDDAEEKEQLFPDEIIKIETLFADLSAKAVLQLALDEIKEITKNTAWKDDDELQELMWRFEYERILLDDLLSNLFGLKSLKNFLVSDSTKTSYVSEADSIAMIRFKKNKADTTSNHYLKAKKVHTRTMARMLLMAGGAKKKMIRNLYSFERFDIVSPYYSRFRLNRMDIFQPIKSDEGRSEILKKYVKLKENYPRVQLFDSYLMNENGREEYKKMVSYWTFLEEVHNSNIFITCMPTYYNSLKNNGLINENKVLIQQSIAAATWLKPLNALTFIVFPYYIANARAGTYASILNTYDLSTGQLIYQNRVLKEKRGSYSDYYRQLKKAVKILQ